ncbi:MAG: YifB family Mg chelatase-like AAA ATPase [Candidatus Roizmanbacteria bacterium]
MPMLSKLYSATTFGLEGVCITVEVDVYKKGFPSFSIVGLPNKAVDESKERVRTSIKNSSLEMPEARIVVNLAPADIPKEGSAFDLPIALGILASSEIIPQESLEGAIFVGELSLNGKVQSASGVLPIALLAREKGIKRLFVPLQNVEEASVVKEIEVYGVDSIAQLLLHCTNIHPLEKAKPIDLLSITRNTELEYDFAEVRGQQVAKRALEISAAGGHNVHLKGPPGTGKTLLARSFPSILPHMDEEEILEVSKIYSVTHQYKRGKFIVQRPFRAPHHTVSLIGMVGGGTKITPGEISLAHRGVLFLDEFPEFPRFILESLRQPLEDGFVTVTRVAGTVVFPARFMMLCASNPCPCGYLGHPTKQCICTASQVIHYKKKISGPMLDRIDLHIDVPAVKTERLIDSTSAEKSEDIRKRVEKARQRQRERFSGLSIKTNAEMTSAMIKKYCQIEIDAQTILKQAVDRFSLSARSYFKIIKTSQTLADLEGSDEIKKSHVLEALQFRLEGQ